MPRGTPLQAPRRRMQPHQRGRRALWVAGEPHVEQCVPAEIVLQVVQQPEEFAVRPREDFRNPAVPVPSHPVPGRRPGCELRPGLAHREVVGRGGPWGPRGGVPVRRLPGVAVRAVPERLAQVRSSFLHAGPPHGVVAQERWFRSTALGHELGVHGAVPDQPDRQRPLRLVGVPPVGGPHHELPQQLESREVHDSPPPCEGPGGLGHRVPCLRGAVDHHHQLTAVRRAREESRQVLGHRRQVRSGIRGVEAEAQGVPIPHGKEQHGAVAGAVPQLVGNQREQVLAAADGHGRGGFRSHGHAPTVPRGTNGRVAAASNGEGRGRRRTGTTVVQCAHRGTHPAPPAAGAPSAKGVRPRQTASGPWTRRTWRLHRRMASVPTSATSPWAAIAGRNASPSYRVDEIPAP